MVADQTVANDGSGAAAGPVVAVSFKMYFDRARTMGYVDDLLSRLEEQPDLASDVRLAVLPDHLTLSAVADRIASTGILLGAQDLAPALRGAYTGEVSGADLHGLGVRIAEIGHAERRTLFGEDDAMIGAKMSAAVEAGLTPLLCIGEPDEVTPREAARQCVEQVRRAIGDAQPSELWVAYEPHWAIGAAQAADPGYVSDVCDEVAAQLGDLAGLSILYGGSAGPGLIGQLSRSVDGLFLGRFAHDPAAFMSVAEEARERG